MLRNLFIFLACTIASLSVAGAYRTNPSLVSDLLGLAGTAPQSATMQAGEAASIAAPPVPRPSGRKISINADMRGHFVAAFRVNGRSIEAMIDTGATLVALNTSSARKAGIHLAPADFSHEVQTANGRVKVALVTLNRLEVGRIALDHVKAVVIEDRALATNLVGMNFLKRLARYQVENNRLLLVQ